MRKFRQKKIRVNQGQSRLLTRNTKYTKKKYEQKKKKYEAKKKEIRAKKQNTSNEQVQKYMLHLKFIHLCQDDQDHGGTYN